MNLYHIKKYKITLNARSMEKCTKYPKYSAFYNIK